MNADGNVVPLNRATASAHAGFLDYRWKPNYESATRRWQIIGHIPATPSAPSVIVEVKHKPGGVDGAQIAGVFAQWANDYEDGAAVLLAASHDAQAETEAAASGAPHPPRFDPDTGVELEAVWLPRHLVAALHLFEAAAERARSAMELRSLADDLADDDVMTPETTGDLATAIRTRADQLEVQR